MRSKIVETWKGSVSPFFMSIPLIVAIAMLFFHQAYVIKIASMGNE